MVKFIKSANLIEQYFDDSRNQICFVGRSNAGKSSLINSLANTSIAKTSGTPGKTKLVNFFDFNNYVLVDLPGYGYAKTSKNEVEIINKMIYEYLRWAKKLICVCQLCSINVITNSDLKMADDLRLLKQKYHIEHLVILTKADKLKLSQINQQIQKVSKFLNVKIDNIIPISNKSKFNIQKLQAIINAINTKSKN